MERSCAISDQIDTATRTMHTEVDVPNPNYQLVPGMYASAKIPLQTAHNALALPVQAVHSSGDGQGTVLVVNRDNKIEKRDVTLGVASRRPTPKFCPALKKTSTVLVGEQSQYQAGRTGFTADREGLGMD